MAGPFPFSDADKAADATRTARDSAQQIWLAGLGALARAQQEGGKVFDALVHEGTELQRKTQAAAEAHLSETTSRVADIASTVGARAAGQWDRLEGIFEERVAKALTRLGIPTAQEVQALHARIDALTQALEQATTQRSAALPANSRTAAPRKPRARTDGGPE